MLAAAIERARDAGVLLSRDGPDHNFLKTKPPIPFTEADTDLLLSVFDRSLAMTSVMHSARHVGSPLGKRRDLQVP